MKTTVFIMLPFFLILLAGCKPSNDGRQTSLSRQKAASVSPAIAKTDVLSEKGKRQAVSVEADISQKRLEHADYEKIAQRMAELEAKEGARKKLGEYASFMSGKSPYQRSVELARVKFMRLTGPPIPGRVLSDEDVASLCENNFEKISKELRHLIAACFGYSCRPALQGSVSDGQALIDYLMQHGSAAVRTRAKLLCADFIAQTHGRQNDAIRLFDEGIRELEEQNADVDEIIASERDRAAAYIYNDDLEGADAAAEDLLRKYSKSTKSKYLWNRATELYWLRVIAWKDIDAEHARDLCKEALELNDGYTKKKGDPWNFKMEHERLTKALESPSATRKP